MPCIEYSKFQKDLLNWWTVHKRNFPWRKAKNPYQLLIAELLLRKTTAEQVRKVYPKLLEKYPSPLSLCSANKKDLENLLKPLGMQKIRADLLKKFACSYLSLFNKKSKISESELLKLPGVGKYAANAVFSLIYGKCVPMVDTNFIRILERIFGIKSNKSRPRNDPLIWKKAKEILPCDRAGNFNLAVLDFSALVCKATNPKCDRCFALSYCKFASENIVKKN
jgi:A/G-specific adenine glycosylase